MKSSTFKSMLMAAVAVITTAGPMVAEAQPGPDRGAEAKADREARQEARQKQRAERAARPERQAPTKAEAPARTGPGADRMRPNRPDRPGQPDRVAPNRAGQPDRVRPNRPDRPAQPDRVRPNRPNQPDRVRPNQPTQTAPVARRPLTPERQRVRRQAQSQIQRSFNRSRWQSDWNRRHSNRGWWRSDRNFRGWNGQRSGFYFAPGYGYYNVPRQYYGRSYYAGSYLPSFFWRYRVSSYSYWGLPSAPPGTAWVYVNNWILLVDLWDGYIIEAIPNAWYW